MKTRSHFTIITMISSILLVAALLTTGCSVVAGVATEEPEQPTGVVEQITLVDSVQASGTVKPQQSATLYWKTTGTVAEVSPQEGETVAAGQKLMALDLASAPANVISAQADLVNARKQLKDLETNAETARVQALQQIASYANAVRDAQYQLDNYTVPAEQQDLRPLEALDTMALRLEEARQVFEPYKYYPSTDRTREELKDALDEAQSDYDSAVRRLEYVNQLEAAQANLEKARADYERWAQGSDPDEVALVEARITTAEATLAQAILKAPFDGEVLELNYLPGDVASLNQPALTLVDRSNLYVEVKVDESDIARVQVGNPAQVTLDALPGETLTGKVTYINLLGQADLGIVKYNVRIELDESSADIPLGATADVTIQGSAPQQALAVPVSAVQNDEQGEYVTIVGTDGAQRRVPVASGALQGSLVAVTGELQPGDQVLLGQTMDTGSLPGMRMFGGGSQ